VGTGPADCRRRRSRRLIGAAAGGEKGARVGAVGGGVGALIDDVLSRNKK